MTKVYIMHNLAYFHIIDDAAFSFTAIDSFSHPVSVTFFGKEAFYFCSNLETFEIPSNSKLTEIKERTFAHTIIKSIKIPSKIKKICDSAFFSCESLSEFEFESDSELEIIDYSALSWTAIEMIRIPKRCVDINNQWCRHTPELNKIVVDPENLRFKNYDDNLIIGKSNLESDDYDVLVSCARNVHRIIVPSFIKKIAACTFENCNDLVSIEFCSDSQIETVERYAMSCSSIVSVSFPCSLKKIVKNAFYECQKLNIIEINDKETFLFLKYQLSTIHSLPIIMLNAYKKE